MEEENTKFENAIDFDYYINQYNIKSEIKDINSYLAKLCQAIKCFDEKNTKIQLNNLISQLEDYCQHLDNKYNSIINNKQINDINFKFDSKEIQKITGDVFSQIAKILMCIIARLEFVNTLVNQFSLYIKE